MSDHFDVRIESSQLDQDTVLVTTQAQADAVMDKILFSALQKYDFGKEMRSVSFSQTSSGNTLTTTRLAELAEGINYNLSSVLEANRYIRKYIALDDIIGETYTSVQNNVNTETRLIFCSAEGRNKQKQLSAAREAVDQLNQSIHLPELIASAIPGTLLEGTYIMYLRTDGGNAVVDYYPLGVAEITDYSVNGNPVVQINLTEFKNRLKKTYTKTRKGKALYFENIDREVQANFPPEVYQAYKAGETYCKLDWRRCGVLRINNMGGKYGVSHFFRALKPTILLEEIENADSVNNRARSKKIIHQKLRKEAMGPDTDYTRKGIDLALYAHNQMVQAWQAQNAVLLTTIPAVESVEYVEPSSEGTPTEKIALYRNEKMTALGITYLDPELNSVSSANISLQQLMKTVDFVARQLSGVLKKWYAVWLQEQGIELTYTPEIKVLDSEQMGTAMRIDLAKFLFSTLNGSHDTAYKILGMDSDDEYAKRAYENEHGFAEVFAPHASQYTSTGTGDGDGTPGRPAGTDPDKKGKQDYDKNYNKR